MNLAHMTKCFNNPECGSFIWDKNFWVLPALPLMFTTNKMVVMQLL